MRQLSDAEKELNRNSIDRIEKKNQKLTYLIQKAQLEVDVGLDLLHREKKEEFIQALKEFKAELESNEKQIDILVDQNTNGVAPKTQTETNYTG